MVSNFNNLFTVISTARRSIIPNQFKSNIVDDNIDDNVEEEVNPIPKIIVQTRWPTLKLEFIDKDDLDTPEPPLLEPTNELTAPQTKEASQTKTPINSALLAIDIEDLLKSEGITQVNGKKIKFGNKALRAANASFGVKNSNHKKRDPHTGNAMARDISIIGGTTQDYSDFRAILLSNKKVRDWFEAKLWGIINEITPAILKRTNGTGPHFHFGPDTWAKRTWKGWINNPQIPITQAL